MNIILKLKSGKEIELTEDEYNELINSKPNQHPVYPLIPPYVYQPIVQYPYQPNQWYYQKQIEITCKGTTA